MNTTSTVSSVTKLPVRCWKYLHMKLTSVKVRYQDDDIESELSRCSEHFKNGVYQFFSHIQLNNIELRESKNATFMESFYQRLSKILLLTVDNCKEIFANYLLYNCNNSATLLQERLEKNIRAVLVSVWSFYAQEQIFFLKCYYHIISSSMDDKEPYFKVFKKFLSDMSIRERHASLLKQYNLLIHQELPSANTYGALAEMLLPLWINYNLREQLEMLHLIILVTSQIEITLSDIEQLIEIIQITSFGRYQCFFYHHSHFTENQSALQQQIHHAVTFYAVQVLRSGWNNDIYAQESSKFIRHNKIMYPTTYDPKQGPIVMAWILVLYHRIMNTSSYDEQLSSQGFTLLDEDLWKVLNEALHSNIMDLPVISKIVEPVIDEMVHEMFTKFGMSVFKSHTTLSSIIAFFCEFHTFPFNKSTSLVLQYFSERFPIDCSSVFKIFGAVLNWCTDIKRKKKMLESLNHFTFTMRSKECKLRTVELNKYVLECDLMPLKYMQNVRVPRGTEVIPDSEENIVTIKRSLPIWSVMRNYLTMYLNGDTNDELLTTVMEIINFVEISLQKVKTIDDDVVEFSELVLHVIWKTSSNCSSPEELNLLAACIKLHSVLFCVMPEDIIKCFEIYNFLPSYPVRMKRKDIQLHDMYYTQSRIYTIVCCKEAKAGVYPVLFSYLNFFRNVVQNMLTSWYTVAGLKFIFHVYNNVNNDFWKFKHLDERNVIIWNCIEVIHEILNHGLKDLYSKKEASSLVDFMDNEYEHVVPTTYFITKSCVQSILSSVNESTIMATAIIGDTVLLETIMESACWTKGKSAVFINIITYSLSLVQRCLIFVDVEKKLKKTEISFDHLFQPEKCLALLSYRYNCFSDTLCVLAIKLLIKLASIKENCMFSWLQYSNELLQKEFLYPLYSCNESNAVKSSLLSLMAVCIMKQIVIADALLEIDKVRKICLEKSVPDSKWQNLLLFTSRYIHDTETKPGTYLNSMHFSVLYVIYACWEKKLKVPQQYYKMSNDFWKCLTLPLHGEPSDSFNGYGFILEIVSLEIVGIKTIDTRLKAVLKSFLNSEHFLKWTMYCSNMIDEAPRLSIEFETVPIPASAVAESWKKFVQVVTSHCSEFIETPGKIAFPIFENLIEELCNLEYRKKEKFLCDIYRICLSTWEKSCSESEWSKELQLTGKMFIFLDEKSQNYITPYFFSALLEVAYKILKFGEEHMKVLNDLENKSDFLIACSSIVNHKLKDYMELISNEGDGSGEYPPLLLHLCIFVNIIKNLEVTDELMAFMLSETDFMNLVLKTCNKVLAISRGTKTAKMLLQFQNFIFEKYSFLKTNFWRNNSIVNIFLTIFPGEVSLEQFNYLQTFTESERNNLFRFGLNFISNLTVEVSHNSKALLIDFHSRNKQYLFTILRMISVTLGKEDLYLVIAVVTFYRRISQHIYYCTFNEVNDLTESMFLLFNCVKTAVSMLIQPSKMNSLLFRVPVHHLQQFFDDSENVSNAKKVINKTYSNLMYLVRMGIQTLSTFCMATDTILHGAWPPEDWNFRWLNKIKNRDDCLFPLLLLNHDSMQEDFTVLTTFITLEHRAFTKRTTIERQPSVENLASNKLMILDYDKSGETLLELVTFLFSQSAMYLLHPQIEQSKKLFFVNQIFVNLKEFIRNAISDRLSAKLEIPPFFDDYKTFQSPPKKSWAENSDDMETDESSSVSVISTVYEDQNEKVTTATFNVVAGLFYKIITTFKHS